MSTETSREEVPRVVLSWPWRADSTCELYAGSDRFLPDILDRLRGARQTIDIELYICESGKLFEEWLEALGEKTREGIRVRLLVDAIGSESLSFRDRRRIEEAGVELCWFNPILKAGFNLVRDHRKLLIIDDIEAWVGGMSLNDDMDPRVRGDRVWLDAMVKMRGPVVEDWKALFLQAWNTAAHPPKKVRGWRRREQKRMAEMPAAGAERMARATASRGGLRNPLLYSLLRRMGQAQRFIWVNTPYFFPPRRLVNHLVRAARRGVRVQLGLAGPITDHPSFRYAGQHYYSRLLRAGVEIYEYQPRFAHLKAAIVDDWCTVGSCNYDRWDNYLNLDANVEVVDPAFCDSLHDLRHEMLENSQRIDPDRWPHRSLFVRSRQAFWFWFGVRAMHLLRNPEDS